MQVECFYNETSETYTVHVCPDRKFKSLCQNLELLILGTILYLLPSIYFLQLRKHLCKGQCDFDRE